MKVTPRRPVTQLLELTPLIDCIFLLLIFFLLASSFVREQALDINLPQAVDALPPDRRAWIVSVDNDNQLFFNQQPLALPALRTTLADAADRQPQRQTLLIRADGDASASTLVTVMDAARDAGLTAVAVAARPASTTGP